ncbi:hypothetical protein QBC38DRAFT_375531 [Podospora fimiseda]|uniref:Uncharacterized protein n=1 Tax=Podospora fimiseda TaxID=252190 RepID=A0AAN6YNY3_9PEZI|nr:hypothetical protein QBC38DRAFT_375531 [Podospora fimiseda]
MSLPPPAQQVLTSLIISRNKHWKYISAYHGTWLQLPPEILENLAHINYNTIRPRPIDPTVFFDLLKIRRLVEQATDLACRAASGQGSNNQLPGTSGHNQNGSGIQPGFRSGRDNMSAEFKFRIREQACQKLAAAYRLDEIACSVNIMQSASALENVGRDVLNRSPHDPDATYVHFFHEKIPSRQLAECTSYDALNKIIQLRPNDPEPLRTRGTVRVFKEDYSGAIADFTEAIKLHQRNPHAAANRLERQVLTRTGRVQEIYLKPDEQPTSMETSIYFHRANVYLTIASQHAAAAFPEDASSQSGDITPEIFEARKQVRANAKRALRDYTAFLSRFEFSPNIPLSVAKEFVEKTQFAVHGKDSMKGRYPQRSGSPSGAMSNSPHKIYAVSELFTPTPPTDLRPFLNNQVITRPTALQDSVVVTETVTYHPLLTEALHCLLLCHCLMQTSTKELLRHAYMVARLSRLSDGYPIFQTSRSPARTDWMEVIRATENWLGLTATWEELCKPTPVPFLHTGPDGTTSLHIPQDAAQAAIQSSLIDAAKTLTLSPEHAATPNSMRALETAKRIEARREEERRQHENYEHMLDTFVDGRVLNPDTFARAMTARKLRAERDYLIENAVRRMDLTMIPAATAAFAEAKAAIPSTAAVIPPVDTTDNDAQPGAAAPHVIDKEKHRLALAQNVAAARDPNNPEYALLTDRAISVARWVLEAPPNAGVVPGEKGGARKKKKKPANSSVKKTTTTTSPDEPTAEKN